MNDPLLPGAAGVDVRVQNLLLRPFASSQQLAIAVDHPAHANEAKPAFFTDAVDRGEVDVVFHGAVFGR